MIFFNKIIRYLARNRYNLFTNAQITKYGCYTIGKNVKMRNCRIFVGADASLSIADNVVIESASIYIEKGQLSIGEHSIISSMDGRPVKIAIDNGYASVGHHSKISLARLWIRFGGQLKFGNYSNINSGSEIRCDESVEIGDFNQISYNVNIWDTNTHEILPTEQRRQRAIEYFPIFGKELSKPKTAPIKIGNDCWIGQNATIMKGCQIGNECIVGFGSMLLGKKIDNNRLVTNTISSTTQIRQI